MPQPACRTMLCGATLVAASFALTSLAGDGKSYPPKEPVYKFTVKTSDRSGAGTDANITATMSSASGSFKAVLNPLMSGNAFERNKTDIGSVKVDQPVGHPTNLVLKTDAKYAGSDWHCEYIEIECPDGEKRRFDYGKWIETDGGKTLSAEIAPANKPWGFYTVTIKTGEDAEAGTDSNIFMTINGKQASVERYRVRSWVAKDNPFEKGDVDKYSFWVAADLGMLTSIRIESDGQFAGADWKMDYVSIVDSNKETTKFTYDRWINDKSLEKDQVAMPEEVIRGR